MRINFQPEISRFSPRGLLRIAGIILTFLVLTYLIFQAIDGIRQVVSYDIRLNWKFLGLSLLAQFIGVTILVLVWRDIINSFGIAMPFLTDFSIIGLSALGRKIPGMVWYVLSRISLYKRYSQPAKEISFSIVYEIFALSLAGIAAFSIGIASGVFPNIPPILRTLLLLGMFAIFSIMLHFFPIIIQALGRFIIIATNQDELGNSSQITKLVTMRWVFGELIVIFCGALVSYYLFLAVDPIYNVSLLFLFTFWGLVVALGPIAVMLPVIVGLQNGLIFILLSMVVPQNIAALATLLWRVWLLILEVFIGLISALYIVIESPREQITND